MNRFALLAAAALTLTALAGCSSTAKDSDGDGLTDATERTGLDAWVDLMGRREVRHVTSDPHDRDTDDDGVSDFNEWGFVGGLDPRNPDTDGDGLTDCQETVHTVIAECEDPDFDGVYDTGTHTSPNNADSEPGGRYWTLYNTFDDPTGQVKVVSWGDGISDGDEMKPYNVTINGVVHSVTTSPLSADSDHDGLDDGEERDYFGTDGSIADMDGDGCPDGRDMVPDRNEKYSLGLDSIKLTDTGGLPVAHIRFTVEFMRSFELPEDGTMTVANGQTMDLHGIDMAPYRPSSCDMQLTRARVVLLHIGVANTDPGGGLLDIASESSPSGDKSLELYFLPRTGQFSWDAEAKATFSGPLHVSGTDGDLVLSPTAS